MAVPEGWLFDKGDWAVGLGGDQWIHEDCKVVAGPGYTDVKGCTEETKQLGDPDEHGVAHILYTITCEDCHSVAVFETTDLVMVDD